MQEEGGWEVDYRGLSRIRAGYYPLCFWRCIWTVTDSFCSAEPSGSPAKDNFRMNRYKNKALNLEEMRRRREEEGIQLRKQKREQQVTVHLISFFSFFSCSLQHVPSFKGNLKI